MYPCCFCFPECTEGGRFSVIGDWTSGVMDRRTTGWTNTYLSWMFPVDLPQQVRQVFIFHFLLNPACRRRSSLLPIRAWLTRLQLFILAEWTTQQGKCAFKPSGDNLHKPNSTPASLALCRVSMTMVLHSGRERFRCCGIFFFLVTC